MRSFQSGTPPPLGIFDLATADAGQLEHGSRPPERRPHPVAGSNGRPEERVRIIEVTDSGRDQPEIELDRPFAHRAGADEPPRVWREQIENGGGTIGVTQVGGDLTKVGDGGDP